jgi:hypothetical protein
MTPDAMLAAAAWLTIMSLVGLRTLRRRIDVPGAWLRRRVRGVNEGLALSEKANVALIRFMTLMSAALAMAFLVLAACA